MTAAASTAISSHPSPTGRNVKIQPAIQNLWPKTPEVQRLREAFSAKTAHPVSHHPGKDKRSKAERILNRVKDGTGGEVRISQRGVPYLVVGSFSAVYFATRKRVRVFADAGNKKFDFDQWPQAKDFLRRELGLDNPRAPGPLPRT